MKLVVSFVTLTTFLMCWSHFRVEVACTMRCCYVLPPVRSSEVPPCCVPVRYPHFVSVGYLLLFGDGRYVMVV